MGAQAMTASAAAGPFGLTGRADSGPRLTGFRKASRADIDLDGRQQQPRHRKLRIAGFAHRDEGILAHVAPEMHVAGALLRDRRLPGIMVASWRLVVVAHEESRLRRQLQHLPDRAVERARVAAREVGPCRPVVRHEQGVTDKGRVPDQIDDVGRRMARRMQDATLEFADRKISPSVKRWSKSLPSVLRSVALKTGRKMRCTAPMCSPMAELCARLRLDIG